MLRRWQSIVRALRKNCLAVSRFVALRPTIAATAVLCRSVTTVRPPTSCSPRQAPSLGDPRAPRRGRMSRRLARGVVRRRLGRRRPAARRAGAACERSNGAPTSSCHAVRFRRTRPGRAGRRCGAVLPRRAAVAFRPAPVRSSRLRLRNLRGGRGRDVRRLLQHASIRSGAHHRIPGSRARSASRIAATSLELPDRRERCSGTELEEPERGGSGPHDCRARPGTRSPLRSAGAGMGVVADEPEAGLDTGLYGVQPRSDAGKTQGAPTPPWPGSRTPSSTGRDGSRAPIGRRRRPRTGTSGPVLAPADHDAEKSVGSVPRPKVKSARHDQAEDVLGSGVRSSTNRRRPVGAARRRTDGSSP